MPTDPQTASLVERLAVIQQHFDFFPERSIATTFDGHTDWLRHDAASETLREAASTITRLEQERDDLQAAMEATQTEPELVVARRAFATLLNESDSLRSRLSQVEKALRLAIALVESFSEEDVWHQPDDDVALETLRAALSLGGTKCRCGFGRNGQHHPTCEYAPQTPEPTE